MIAAHPPPPMLLDHAAGTLPLAADVLVATHIALCARCRSELAVLEEAAGAFLDELPPVPGDDEAGLAALLGALDGPLPPPTAPMPFPDAPPEDLLPGPLRRLVGPSADLKWRTTLPGVGTRALLDFGLAGIPASLEEVYPGHKVPTHGHEGVELTLVLAGGYTDRDSHYARGDVQVVGAETVHGLHIDDEGFSCVLLSIRSGPRLPDGLKARVASWLGAI
jgi:putative transcriptional regulator